MANFFFGQVTDFSGFGGISGIQSHTLIGSPVAHPNRLYYIALVATRRRLRAPALRRAHAVRVALQGVRDDPVRMSSLGYNVVLHRTLAFGLAAFLASIAGVLFVWWNGHIDPSSIDLTATIELLVIAVIGGLYRLEGAWIGAFVFVVSTTTRRSASCAGSDAARFETLIGVVFLVIVLLSPNGLLGIWDWIRAAVTRATRHARGPDDEPPQTSPA